MRIQLHWRLSVADWRLEMIQLPIGESDRVLFYHRIYGLNITP